MFVTMSQQVWTRLLMTLFEWLCTDWSVLESGHVPVRVEDCGDAYS